MKVALRALGFELNQDELNGIIAEVDKDTSGALDFSEFMNLMIQKMVGIYIRLT